MKFQTLHIDSEYANCYSFFCDRVGLPIRVLLTDCNTTYPTVLQFENE